MAVWDDDQRPPRHIAEGVDEYGVIIDRTGFSAWLSSRAPQEIRDLEGFLSDQWLTMLVSQDVPPPSEWEHATIHRTLDGDWSVVVIDVRGTIHAITLPGGDRDAKALFWDDLYGYISEDLAIEVDREIDSPDAGAAA